MPSISATISATLDAHLEAIRVLRTQEATIQELGAYLVTCLRDGNRIFLCGNGGSAADAQHIAAEMVCRFETNRRALPAIALTTDTSALTAIANDFGYERVFARQVEALARPGDLLIGISTSGNSGNIIAAVEQARDMGVATLGLLGGDGGKLRGLVDHEMRVPVRETARVQECHILIGHIWCSMIDEAFAEPL
ncbi:MAG: SIS domain-containing protein [Pseudomonadota bacterium]|nr:SIS domain-containing protein [Pseudomonadota bacterium]